MRTFLVIVAGLIITVLMCAVYMAGLWAVFNADIETVGEAILIGLIFLVINAVVGIAGIFLMWLIDRPKEQERSS
jgi:uncharacterized membrane-anchored protein